MNFIEDDIDFEHIDWKQFEELCYDLLLKFHYHTLSWRKGGPDKGRDIEAYRYVTDTIAALYIEKWFIECKNHQQGLPIEEVIEKISWAEMEKADHFLLITSSYLTLQTRDWLELARKNKHFTIHVIEGKELKKKLLLFPDILIRYFADDYTKLIRNMVQQWLYHDILPEPKALYQIYHNAKFDRLDENQLGFLWYAFNRGQEAIDDYCDVEGLPAIEYDRMIPFDFIIPYLKAACNRDYPVMKISEDEKFFNLTNGLGVMYMPCDDDGFSFASVHFQQSNGERIQVVLIKENKRLEVRIGVGYKNPIQKVYNDTK